MRMLFALVLISTLASCRHVSPLAGDIAPGYRAFAIPIDAHEGTRVRPRDRVDIDVSGPVTAGKSLPLFHRAYVIDVDKAGGQEIIWVAMNPNEAQYAALVAEMKLKIQATILSSDNAPPMPTTIPGGFRRLFR